MKYTLLCALALTLAGCSTSRPPAAVSSRAEPTTADASNAIGDAPALPAGVVVQPPQSAIGKLRGWPKPKPAYFPPGTPVLAGKKSTVTINQVHGNQSNTSATIGKKATGATGEGAVATLIEKKAGPAVVASDSATQNTVGNNGNIQATNGNGNSPQLMAPVQQAADWRAVLAKPAGQVGAAVVGLVLVGGLTYGVVSWRKKKAVTDLV